MQNRLLFSRFPHTASLESIITLSKYTLLIIIPLKIKHNRTLTFNLARIKESQYSQSEIFHPILIGY